jgi:NAD(P)-dependent dehydrogenase (short-subunit alcohol dehydrogenase family)
MCDSLFIFGHMSLKNMNILVTGASKGIGTAISKYLLKEGANVILHYNSSKEQVVELSNKYRGQAVPMKADLAVESDIYALMENSIKAFDKIDTIVLNAAVYLRHASYIDSNHWFKVWKKTLSINLDAVGLLTKLGIDHFKENNGGRFVYIGSRAVFRGETQEYLAYAASKGGITSLARSVARSFGKDNIKSFVIAPGFVKTDMAEQFIRDYGKARVINELALNKLTEPKDIAPLAGLMCSGQMDHATGSTIDINAGSHIR